MDEVATTPRERRLARRAERRAATCARLKPYPNTPQGRARAWRAAKAVALGELARNIVHRMTVYVCLHNPEHVHVGGRACPFAVGSQGSLDRAGWADALDGELTRTAAQLEEKCMQLNQTQARVVEGIAELDYWDRRIIIGDAVVCDGKCYSIGHEGGSRTWRGYGGARWLIRFADGRELCTSNLWHNGTVPTTHRRALPDNATIEGIAFPRIFPESPDDVEF